MVDPKILICVPTTGISRCVDFYDWFDLIDKPMNTLIHRSHGQSPARNRNIAIEHALENNCTHVFFVDDDVFIPKDGLMKLLAHDEDIITGLYLMRHFPHRPILFRDIDGEGNCDYLDLIPGLSGKQEIYSTGLGCVLVKIHVIKALEKPYIRLGQMEKDHWCDDNDFYKRIHQALPDLKMYVDLDVRCGHVSRAVMWPDTMPNGDWISSYDTDGTARPGVRQFYRTE